MKLGAYDGRVVTARQARREVERRVAVGILPPLGPAEGECAMSFLTQILDNLRTQPERAKVIEVHATTLRGTDGAGMLDAFRSRLAFSWADKTGAKPPSFST